jgi:hypothetical protein
MLVNIKIHVADAFSLDFVGDGEHTRLAPVLHRAGGDPAEPLLAEPLRDAFAHRQFNGFTDARQVYALGNGNLLVLSPPLRRALSVVRPVQSAPPATRRELFANPRAFLREALDDEDETLIENIVRDTPAYSERVIRLGLWRPRVVPWVQVASTDWFGGAPPTGAGQSPAPAGLLVGDRRIELSPAAADDLRNRIERAISAGEPTVELECSDEPLAIPATTDTLTALARMEAARTPSPTGEPRRLPLPAEVLLIHPNEETLELEALVANRPASPSGLPAALTTEPKDHRAKVSSGCSRHGRKASQVCCWPTTWGWARPCKGSHCCCGCVRAWRRASFRTSPS